MQQSVLLKSLILALCFTMAVSLIMSSLAQGNTFVNASHVKKLKDPRFLKPKFKQNETSVNNGNASTCPGCSDASPDEDKIRLEIIKQKILSQLQMTKPPTRLREVKRLPTLLTQMNLDGGSQQNTEPVDEDDQKIAKALQYVVLGERVLSTGVKTLRFKFSFSSKIYTSNIKSAKLWVHKRQRPTSPKQTRMLIVRDPNDQIFQKTQSQRSFQSTDNGWMDFKLTVMVNKWVEDDRMKSSGGRALTYKHTIEVICKDCNTSRMESTKNIINYLADNHRPMLIIDLKTPNSRRRKRHSPECAAGMTRCCLKRLYVDFSLFNWQHWILMPSGFYANYCTGSCKGHVLPKFHHSSIVQLVISDTTHQNITQCCAPSQLSDLSLLYYDDSGVIILKHLSKLKVDDCMCS